MKIVETLFINENDRIYWAEKIKSCDWDAGWYLGDVFGQNSVETTFGESSQVLLLTDNGRLVSFCTFAGQDEIDAPELTPWIGFVYTFPEYRGHRYAGVLISYCEKLAKQSGYEKIYISSEEKGLYEKYGFSFVKNADSVHGYETGIFCKVL